MFYHIKNLVAVYCIVSTYMYHMTLYYIILYRNISYFTISNHIMISYHVFLISCHVFTIVYNLILFYIVSFLYQNIMLEIKYISK